MAAALTPRSIDAHPGARSRTRGSRRAARAARRSRARRTRATCSTGSRRRARSSRRRRVPADYTYDYAIVRVVPRVERGEQINVGVILSCADADFLDARIELDERAAARARSRRGPGSGPRQPRDDPGGVRGRADAGPIGELPPRGRFRWLVSPRSTIIQPSAGAHGRDERPGGVSRAPDGPGRQALTRIADDSPRHLPLTLGAAPRREHQRLPAIPAGQLRLWLLPALGPTRRRRARGSDTAPSGRRRSCRFAEAAGLRGDRRCSRRVAAPRVGGETDDNDRCPAGWQTRQPAQSLGVGRCSQPTTAAQGTTAACLSAPMQASCPSACESRSSG